LSEVQLTLFPGEGWWSMEVKISLFKYCMFYCKNLFSLGHWNCEPKCDSVSLHVVHLNIMKNNNTGVLWWIVVFALSNKCVNSPNLFYYICGKFTPQLQRKSITPIVKKAY